MTRDGYSLLGRPNKMSVTDQIRRIFPSSGYFVFFIFYVLLYICQGWFRWFEIHFEGCNLKFPLAILIRLSKNNDTYDYNTNSAVLITELIKLIIACGIYLKDNSIGSMYESLRDHSSLIWLYMIPSILYCIYNNLIYVNLSHYDPTTYYILLQLRIAVTGIVYQILFSRYLNKTQWASLLLLTFGCIMKQLDQIDLNGMLGHWSFSHKYLLFIGVQVDRILLIRILRFCL